MNPYDPPKSPLGQQAIKLFSPGMVVLATIIGSLIAGFVLIALNYLALGRRDLANRVFALGLGAHLVVLALALWLSGGTAAGFVLMFAQAAIAYGAAHWLQAASVRYHLEQGGSLQSVWRAVGIGILVGVVFAVVLVLIISLVAGVPQPAAT